MESKSKIDIILTCWNRPEFTHKTIDAIRLNTKYPYRLIVIDNGSEPKLQYELAQRKHAGEIDTLVLLDKNYGLEHAKHLGMNFVESSYFISTDNDILAYKYDDWCWLSRLIDLMNKNPEYAAIALRPQILVGTGNIFDGKDDEIIEFSHVPGYLRIMRTDLVNQIGAWKDKRPLRGHEEIWSSERLRALGYKVGWANHIQCWHLFGDGNWGYDKLKPEAHGHNEVSGLPKDDLVIIKNKVGI